MNSGPPAHLLERISGSSSRSDFEDSFVHLRKAVHHYLAQAGFSFNSFNNILDLGCGVGRFALAFKDILQPNQKLYACDVHQECAEWCKSNISWAETIHSDIEPPLDYASGQFDLVYGLSVFTHLNLDLQFRWAAEIHRILKPGGVAFLTFHGTLFIAMFFQNQMQDAAVREIYSVGDDGLFAYLSNDTAVQGQVDVASAHNDAFIKEQFAAFDIIRYFPRAGLAREQDLYVFTRPADALPIALPCESNTHTSQSFKFSLSGQRRFRFLTRVIQPDMMPVVCAIRIESQQGLIFKKLVPLNRKRLFGPSHYFVTEVDVPSYSGQVSVSLELSDSTKDTQWYFPHFIS